MERLICFLIIPLLMIGCAEQKSTTEVPEPYYDEVPQRYGVDYLQGYLNQRGWIKDYNPSEFDCSEMSALLECMLENEGFHTWIVMGKHEGIPHCWLEVEVKPYPDEATLAKMTRNEIIQLVIKAKKEGHFVIVEATTLEVITSNSSESQKYRWNYRYETIYEALEVSSTAFDWWN